MASDEHHLLLQPKAIQTIALGGVGLAGVGLMAAGGILLWGGLAVAVICCALLVWLHWAELTEWRTGWGYSRGLTLPILTIVAIGILAVMAFNKDAILAWGTPKRPSTRMQKAPRASTPRPPLTGPAPAPTTTATPPLATRPSRLAPELPAGTPAHASVAHAPVTEPSTAQAAPALQSLKRLIAYDLPRIDTTGERIDKTADQFHWWWQVASLFISNVSDDTLNLRVARWTIGVDGVEVADYRAPTYSIIQQTKTLIYQVRPAEKTINLDTAKVIRLSFDIEYDTIPATGIRRSMRIVDFNIERPNAGRQPMFTPHIVYEAEK